MGDRIYTLSLSYDGGYICGKYNTLPDMAVTIVIAVAAGKIINGGHTAK